MDGPTSIIRLSELAEMDIRSIGEYHLNAAGKARSEKIVTSIFESIELIARDPYLHPRFKFFYRIDFQVHSKVHFQDYRIIYQILNDEIIVLRIWHAACNPRKLKLP